MGRMHSRGYIYPLSPSLALSLSIAL
uniref:Uncharacterized protein n=1 Tax=Rhizophora mucronata TaxID=61149 RepID=A0A2P2K8D2_RHIMU